MKRVKDIVSESLQRVNEAQLRDATPQFQALLDSAPSVAQSIGDAYGQVSSALATAKLALEAINSASDTAQSSGVESNAIVDNIGAAQQSDPSSSIITLTDHRAGVQQAYNVISTILSCLNTANGLCNKLNQLCGRQFL